MAQQPDSTAPLPRILVLAEGDPESYRANSGTVRSIVDALRHAPCTVVTANVDLSGMDKALAALMSFSPNRRRWGVKYHTGALPFALRSARANAALRRAGPVDAIIQYGSTFLASGSGTTPYYLYMDSNMVMAQHAPVSWATSLTPRQVAGVVGREREAYSHVSGILAFSEHARRSFVDELEVDPARTHTVFAGPNLVLDGTENRAAFDKAPPTILFVGVEFERKGGPQLLAAFREVRAQLPDAQLLIVGPRDLAVSEPGVTVVGHLRKDEPADRARLMECYARSSVFCLPTRYEPFGVALLEAMHHGLPCIATSGWAIPEIIEDGRTGYLVELDDTVQLADRLTRLLSRPDEAAAMGAAGMDRARRLFSWDSVARRMLDVAAPGVHRQGVTA
jgi:glycosyltransferase involved in cell wall biosynthesis